ncbi:unnamed protein product [Mytilus coruscus]|uniref:Uncharacterized protein n=1 Tax=Mytilus coruscus TaxID=42192 RepID=A0A6J8C2K9_MYTCO|nr:unnamed protein product [Mytilus coruscus]
MIIYRLVFFITGNDFKTEKKKVETEHTENTPEINNKQKNKHQLPDFEDFERIDVKEEECYEQQIGTEGGSELLQDNLEECIATPIPSTSNKMKGQSSEHQEFEICNQDQELKVLAEEGNSDRKKEVEEEMKHIMRKLKNAQEALRKALQERLCQLGEEKSKINKDFEQMPLSVEIQDFLKDLPEEDNDSDLDFEPLCKKNKDE